MKTVEHILQTASHAKYEMAALDEKTQNKLLQAVADAVKANKDAILQANRIDLENAKGNISDDFYDRLKLDDARIDGMVQGIEDVVALKSPVGMIESETTRDNGLVIQKVRVPIGVVAIIYEARPNVTTDAAALCIKSGNACILRGGSDAIHTNTAVAGIMRRAIAEAGGPQDAVQLIEDTSHASSRALMEARGLVDLLIPRGGKNLIAAVTEGAKGVPVIETGTGICHVYIDADADLDMAMTILENAKTNRPGVCNSAEVCLVHQAIAGDFLPKAAAMLKAHQVEMRLDEAAARLIDGKKASPSDFDTEFLDKTIAIGVVPSFEDAIRHVNTHSSGHSDAIVTQNQAAADAFLHSVDSAAVYHNASTRFTDGGVFGLGCEMGISTQKIGARGPMGLYELTSYKYVVKGTGQVRG